MKARPTAVAQILSAVVERVAGVNPGRAKLGRRAFAVIEAFERIGPPMTDHATAKDFRRARLTIEVRSSVWLTELGMMQAQIIERLNARLPGPWVEEVRLVLGSPRPKRVTRTVVAKPRITRAQRAQVESWSEGLPEELKDAFARAAESGLAARKKKAPAPYEGPPGPRTLPLPVWVDPSELDDEPKGLTYGYGDRQVDRWKLRRELAATEED